MIIPAGGSRFSPEQQPGGGRCELAKISAIQDLLQEEWPRSRTTAVGKGVWSLTVKLRQFCTVMRSEIYLVWRLEFVTRLGENAPRGDQVARDTAVVLGERNFMPMWGDGCGCFARNSYDEGAGCIRPFSTACSGLHHAIGFQTHL